MRAKIKFSELGRRMLKWIPNALTLCNSLCGFAAILCSFRAFETRLGGGGCLGAGADMKWFFVAAFLIFCAMIFDAMDGLAARLLNAASLHGIQMDSLSDMVTFGVAPAVLVVMVTESLYNWHAAHPVFVYACSAIYLGGAALRLATYNVAAMNNDGKKNPNWFSGMPSPGAAAALCVVIFVMPGFRDFFKAYPLILPVYAGLLGILMVSGIPYLHAGRFLMSVKRNPRRLILLVLVILAAAVFRYNGVAAVVTLYVLSGPVTGIYNLLSRKGTSGA
ncbi:MAG: CDP-alcohol phosphatidyltransferase family protein [Lentisphaeria bacterium]|nr:CDP-alcohol phosphatidyltransferase family protein [Lentisphaeria bacterium]